MSGRRFVTLCCILWYKILIFIELVKWQLGRDDMSRKFEAKQYLRNTFYQIHTLIVVDSLLE